MKRNILIGMSGVLFLALLLVSGAFSQGPGGPELRAKSQKAMTDGNFKDAYEGFKKLCLDPKDEPPQVANDLNQAVQCLHNLGRINEIDELVEGTITAHKGNWRLLAAAAQQYVHLQHQGFIIAGKFERGPHRGGGKFANSVERDRTRGMQLLNQALPLVAKDDNKAEVAQFYLNFAETLLNHRGVHEAWRLQYLTNLAELPDYDEAYYGYREYNGAPVDAEGKPVYHTTPKKWEVAETDGQRWRWLLEQAAENHPPIKDQVRMHFAQFMEQLFGVQTMAQGRWGRGFGGGVSDDDTKKNESGTYDLHTLKEDETIAKLASGIKRFKLPDEFNFIKIYQQVAADGKGMWGENALTQLSQVFENRRQYPAAAKYWQQNIKSFGPGQNNWKNERLEQIVSNWGTFEGVATQPAGQGATVEFRYRNGKQVKFDARKIKVPELLADIKAYLKSDPGNRIDWNKINIANIGYRLVHEADTKYLGEATAAWELDLEPRENHFDKRITVTTPLQKPGAYLVTATMANGNVSKIILWVADTAIVRKQLDGKTLYYIADAVTGSPIADANLEFFGWQQRHLGGNRYQVVTTNFAENTNADGMVTPDPKDLKEEGYQWLVTSTTKNGRFAFQGFLNVWTGRIHDQEYNQIKAFAMTDRPVYRPGQKVNFKFWVRKAQYDQPDASDFAKKTFVIEVHSPKGEKVLDKTIEADEYGGIVGEYDLPADATLGQYYINIMDPPRQNGYATGGNTFRVEEYKKPEYEVTIDAPKEPVMLGEKITAKINAKYYFGSPVTKAKVKYKVLRTDHSQEWYPHMPWDWCYGPGYWWYAYDYPWYKGFHEWAGCMRPLPPWIWRGHQQPPEVVAEVEREIGEDGTISVEIDTAVAKELHGNTDHEYTVTAEVRDDSRRTIVGTGKVLVARKPFKIFSWVDRGYYRVGDVIQANFKAQTLDDKPVPGKGSLTLLKITYDKNRQPVETPVQRWDLNTGEEGMAKQQIKATQKGQYRLSYKLTDSKKHVIEGGYLFTIVGQGFDGADFRFNNVELIPDKQAYNPGEKVSLQLNTDRANSTVLLFIRPTNGVYLAPKLLRLKGKSVIEEIAVIKKDMPNFFVEAVTVSGGKVYTETKELIVPPEKRVLNVEVLPSAKEYKPGEKAKVKVHLTDFNGENFVGSTVLTMYDKSVEYISGGSNVPDIKDFFWKWRRHHNPQQYDSLSMLAGQNMTLPNKPGMGFLGVFGHSVAEELDVLAEGAAEAATSAPGGPAGFGGGGMRGRAMFANGLAAPGAPMAGGAAMAKSAAMRDSNAYFAEDKQGLRVEREQQGQDRANKPGDPGGTGPLVEATVRSKFADTAKWVASLTTDKTGNAEIELDMPENLTSWKIRVWGMGHGTKVGSGEADVVTRKNLIVRLQAPRFFVQKDEVVLSANVHNYLKTAKDVSVSLEIPGNKLKSAAPLTKKVKIPAGGEMRVDWLCTVLDEGEAVVRMKGLTDEESDAMEMKLPCFIHGMLKTDSYAGTVKPDKDSSRVSFNVPKERRVEQSLLEVRYSPSLAMAMVDALPYLAEYPYNSTDQTLNRFLPSVITQRTLIDMKLNLAAIRDKRTNLNAQEIGDDKERAKGWKRFDRNPVFDEEELARMVKEGVKALTEQQISDGGWGWFSGAGEQSWPHTTAVVVHGLQVAKANDVALVPGMLERGIEWLKRYQAEQIQYIKNWEKKEPNIRKKQFADELDAFVYMILVDADSNNDEMKDFLYRDRVHLAVYAKAMFGLALEKIGDKEKLAMILENIKQFVVEDEENETAYLKLPENNYWWYWYGSEVEANAYYLKLLAKTDGKGERAPRLVKYLLNNRKHATYWSSTRDTAVCVEAFAEFIRASGEQEPQMTVELWLDGEKKKEVEITKDNLFTYDNKFVVAGADLKDGGHEVEIRRKGKGNVYFNAYVTNFTLEDHITKAGLEVKVNRKYYQLIPVDKKIKVEGVRGQALDQKVEKFVRKELKEGDTLKSGDQVEIELEIDSKNDYEYILFEDMKAAGFEPVDLRSGYNSNSLGAYMELRDNRVSFFVRALARGKHSVSYKMRAEIPGKFAALPAKASAMYAPELRGNSDEIKLKIVD
ncbi:MAG: alpha-2-macroglobulin family protein [Pirellulaceae bacterium]